MSESRGERYASLNVIILLEPKKIYIHNHLSFLPFQKRKKIFFLFFLNKRGNRLHYYFFFFLISLLLPPSISFSCSTHKLIPLSPFPFFSIKKLKNLNIFMIGIVFGKCFSCGSSKHKITECPKYR